MPRSVSLLLLLALVGPVRAESPGEEAPKAPVVRVPLPASERAAPRALRYALLPDALDLTPGNAAPTWLRAGYAAARVSRKLTEKEYAWTSRDLPLDKLPRDEVRRLLADYAEPLRLADLAARFNSCDWGRPPWTYADLRNLPLDEIQTFRQLAWLLSLRFRLELAEGHFDRAIDTLQTGLTLARHVDAGSTLIEHLVAVAIATIMFTHVEEFVATPGAPNLYWPLTTLPRPFLDLRRIATVERDALYRSFPMLRRLGREKLSPEQAQRLADELFPLLGELMGTPPPERWQVQLLVSLVAVQQYPEARRALIAAGRPAAEVESMAVFQVVLLYFLDEYDRLWDEHLKWMSVPYAEGREPLERLGRELTQEGTDRLFLLRLLSPALQKTYEATARLDRQIATLRCVEAVRQYAAGHDGKPPQRLEDIKAVPLPADPATGGSFAPFYKADGDRAVLDVPPLPGAPALLGRRYEFGPP